MYYIECPVYRKDSIAIFTDLISRGHLRFYGTDNPREPEVVIFRVCLPEALRYGLPTDLISSYYPIYDSKYARYVDFDLSIKRSLSVDPQLVLYTDTSTVMWDRMLEEFVGRQLYSDYKYDFSELLKTGEVLRYLGFPRDFFVKYHKVFYQSEDDEYIFENTADIWK